MAGQFNPEPSSIQIARMLRRPPPVKVGFTPMIKGPAAPRPLGLRRGFQGGGIIDDPMRPHVGPVHTSTPGRGDLDPTHVPQHSYVMSAEDVAHLGEGNSANGLELLSKMFPPAQSQLALMRQGAPYGGTGAPYGAASPHLQGGRGVGNFGAIPRGIEPRVVGLPKYPVYAGPGQQGPNFVQAHGGVVPGEPGGQFLDRMGAGQAPGTPINISGGEFVIPPEEVKRVGRGDISLGHEVLDKWVKNLRQEHINTLKRLPGPAK